jgi:hypothetical protein
MLLLAWLMATRAVLAGWELTPPGDPNRNWAASVTLRGAYDDNFYYTEKNKESGLQFSSDIVLRASVPLERFFMGLNYDYGIIYPRDVRQGGVDETHNVSVSANYTFSPRLTLSLNENFISSFQPQLVQTQAGVPVTLVYAGSYIYDTVGGNLNYALTPRWSLALNGSWDIWRYEVSSVASNNDVEDYQTTLSALYALDQRTTVGINYQYGQNVYLNPGTNNALNGQSDSAYLSVVHRFSPRLSLQLNGGYTIRESGDGTMSSAPSAYGSLAYNYGLDDTISLIIAHALTAASVQVTRLFSTSENTSVALQINHRFTARLRTVADCSYVYSTFSVPVYTFLLTAQEQALTAHLGFNYAFRDWLSVVLDYYYIQLTSDVHGWAYDRNQVSLGVTLSY